MPRVEFITIERLLEMRANKEQFTPVEVLSEEEYKSGHIPGAINIPLEKLETLAPKQLGKGDTIVVYCASYSCQASTRATQKLLEMGYSKTIDFKAGKRGWAHAAIELEK